MWKDQGMRPKFRIGLVQMTCSKDPEENLEKAVARIRKRRARAQIICLQELFRSQYFCREEDATQFELAEAIPGRHGDYGKDRAETAPVVVASVFERRAAACITIRRRAERDGTLWDLPEDAYTGRPAVLREVLLHAGRPGLPNFETAYGRIGSGVLDQCTRAARLTAMQGRRFCLPDGHRLASTGEGKRGKRATGCLADGAAGHAIANGCTWRR